MIKRSLDVILSLIAILILSPLLIPIIVLLKMTGEGYIFYQASYQPADTTWINEDYKYQFKVLNDITLLAVVKNYGRLFPYISSIIMSIGLLLHLLINLPKLFKKNITGSVK